MAKESLGVCVSRIRIGVTRPPAGRKARRATETTQPISDLDSVVGRQRPDGRRLDAAPVGAHDEAARRRARPSGSACLAPATPRSSRLPAVIRSASSRHRSPDRLQDLVPLRHARMAESPFAYYRGTPAVMAFDLSTTPRTDIVVQASGDAHLSNFGIYASPERHIVFDANDFDETLPAPWEWDVKRLAASIVVAGRGNGVRCSGQPRCHDGDRALVSRVDGAVRRDAPHRRVVLGRHRAVHPRRGGTGLRQEDRHRRQAGEAGSAVRVRARRETCSRQPPS